MKKEIPHPEFAHRIAQAIDGNPDIPDVNFGRLRWFVDRFAEHGMDISISTINAWIHGAFFPRRSALVALAAILKVDAGWLAGDEKPVLSKAETRIRNVVVNGAVNAVAGFILMDGGHPAFPTEDDTEANAKKVNLYAIIRSVKYNFHVTAVDGVGEDSRFLIPAEAEGNVVLGVMRDPGFSIRIFELDWEVIMDNGVKRNRVYDLKVAGNPMREIMTFTERL